MKWFDFTFDTPAENLACDEALLDLGEREGVETLRFWESREVFIVVGYGNHVSREVNVDECRRRGIPILRRCSGGGTVVQGSGCLSYNLVLKISESGPHATVTSTNEFVMERNRAALEKILGAAVSVQGHTDLAFLPPPTRNPNRNRNLPLPSESEITITSKIKITSTTEESAWHKFSGNAQRRRRRALVFHGTILYAFDLSLIDALLKFPSAQPDYRASRGHAAFVRNVSASTTAIKESLRQVWGAEEEAMPMPPLALDQLVRDQYANDDWNFRR